MNHNFVSVKILPFQWLVKLFFPQHSYPYDDLAFVDIFSLNIFTIGNNNLISIALYKHKQAHIEQVKRDGRFKFICKYLYYNIKYGYKNNPYEVEAREVASK